MGREPRGKQHLDECRCAECWPFQPDSDAERSWAAGDRCSDAAPPIRPGTPALATALLPVLPGDVEILGARLDALDAMRHSGLGCEQSEEGKFDEVDAPSAAPRSSPGPEATRRRRKGSEVPSPLPRATRDG